MGTMTRDEVQTEVLENLDNREDVTDTQAARWINHAYSHMTHPSVAQHEDLAVTFDLVLVSGQASYSLAAAVLGYRVLALRNAVYIEAASTSITPNTRRFKLKPKPVEWYDSRQHPNTTHPSNYVIGEGQTILISNTPGNTNTVRLRLWREAASLSAGTSTTVLPEYYDEALVMGAQGFFEFKLGYRDRANQTFQMYGGLLRDAAPKDLIEAQNWGIETQLAGPPMMGVSR